MKRYVCCNRCGMRIYEGRTAVRDKKFTAFYCSYRCYALDQRQTEETVVTEETLKEDNLMWDGSSDFEYEKTWSDIYREFRKTVKIDESLIVDYRPCKPPYYGFEIPNTIIVWVKNGYVFFYSPQHKKGDRNGKSNNVNHQ